MDLLAVFRARVTAWCVNAANKSEEAGDANKENLALLKPPFRLISHGHELTPDLDSKSLGELGIRDQQVSRDCLDIFLFSSVRKPDDATSYYFNFYLYKHKKCPSL